MKNYYEVLGVPRDAELAEIKKKYRLLLLASHPDKKGTQAIGAGASAKSSSQSQSISPAPRAMTMAVAGSEPQITLLQTAYQTLSNTTLRQEYDIELTTHLKKIGISESDGLDEVDLDEFVYFEDTESFTKDCPRCTGKKGFIVTEQDLLSNGVNDEGVGELIVQCSHCSLWLKVVYVDEGSGSE